MQLSEKNIADFQAIYKEQFGKEISRAEALGKGLSLLNLIKIVYKTSISTSVLKEQRNGIVMDRETLDNVGKDRP